MGHVASVIKPQLTLTQNQKKHRLSLQPPTNYFTLDILLQRRPLIFFFSTIKHLKTQKEEFLVLFFFIINVL